MPDTRYSSLADTLINYSCDLQPGETVFIEAIDVPHRFTRELVRTAYQAEAVPLVFLKSQSVMRELMLGASERQMTLWADSEVVAMEGADAYIGIRGSDNVSELSDVPAERMNVYETTVWKRVHIDIRVDQKKWTVLRWPSASMAQLAQVSTEAFEDFYFRVCTMDYPRMSEAMMPLRDLMNATDRVRIVSPGTDISFSIAGIPAVECDGKRNIPDGEVFTAPVLDSVNGTIQFNTETLYQGVTHEFAIGFNPYITRPMKDILFDEKIAGSIHLTPGNAYEVAFNGNRSQVHWDLVLIQTPEWGGGELYFDDRLVRKDGRFVVPELEGLNPESLEE
jgi:aminopeptidase